MTQRLDTKLGTQGGLETNVQADQSAGYQIADNVIFRPIGGISKRRGSKKLVETVTGETKRLVSPTQDGTGVLSIQEVDSTGTAKVLGYKKEGLGVDLYSQEGSNKVLINPSASFTLYNKIRLDFEESIYTDDLDFIENAFENKLGVFCGFFTPLTSFTTIAVEQDSLDPDLLRVARFVNFPLKNNEITISNPASFSVAPTLLSTYDIISITDNYFTIYPIPAAPAWTSTGDTGTLTITFNSFQVIDVSENALSSESLINQTKVFYEVQGLTPITFSTSEVSLCLEDRSGDEIVFNADQGQMYISDEDPNEPKVSYYGTEQPIDCLPYYITTYASSPVFQTGTIKEQTRYAYSAVLEKVINDQSFISAPSPAFYIETEDESANYITLSGVKIGLTVSGDVFFVLGLIPVKTIQLKNVTSTPVIPDFTQIILAENTLVPGTFYWSIDQQILTLGAQVTAISQADIFINRQMICDVGLPEGFHTDLRNVNPSPTSQYYINLYRTLGVDTSSSPDTTQFFLVKREKLGEDVQAPTITVFDNEISDLVIESQLPLYTNPTEEGILKANNLAPQHQTFVEKNGVFYLGDLKKQETVTTTIFPNPTIPTASSNTFNITYNLASFVAAFTPVGSPRYYNISEFFFGSRSKRIYIDNGGNVYNALDNSLITSLYPNFLVSPYEPLSVSLSPFNKIFGLLTNGTHFNLFCRDQLRKINCSPYDTASSNVGFQTIYYAKLLQANPFLNSENRISIIGETRYLIEVTFNNSSSIIQNLFPGLLLSNTNFGVESFRYQIAYSKPFEPAAFPSLQFLNVGSTRNIIYGVFKVRDSLIIASKEGFYRLTGDNEQDYVISLIESDTAPLTPLLMTEQQDRVLALTQKGLAACTESNVQIIDTPIQDITERFLQLYRDDLDTFTVKQTYTAAPRFLNQVVFYIPTLKERDTSKSTFGISFDTSYGRFSTVDLYVDDEEKNGILSNAFDASRFSNESYSVPSFEPSSLQVVRAEVTRSDFAQNECFIELGTFWQATGSITAGSSILTITTSLDHRLQAGDYVTLIFGEAFVTTATGLPASLFDSAVYLADVSGADPKVLTVDLGSVSGSDITSQEVRFRFGRSGLPVTLNLTTGSSLCSLTLASQADVGWLVGQKIVIQKPYGVPLNSIEPLLTSIKTISSISLSNLEIILPTNSPITTSSPAMISEELRSPYKQTFSFVAPSFDNEKDFGILERNSRLLYPFESEDKGERIQGFLERPWDSQWKPDRPSKIFDGVQSTLMTARITGGDPCSLKNFGQFIIAMQSIFSMSKVNISFQGDRYDAVQGVTFNSQSSLDAPFDPAFADVLWSTIAQQWASITNPHSGWKEAAPFTPIRITTPNNVSQSTYLAIFLRHDRPFETFALGSMAVNGVFIDPTSAGV